MAFLERILDKDYSHYRPHGNIENREQYLEDRKNGSVDFDSPVADDIKVRVFVRKNGQWTLVHGQATTTQKP